MQVVEQTAIIEAPLPAVMEAVNDIEGIPGWATVKGTVTKMSGSPDSYDWRFEVGNLNFAGQLKVIEQTEHGLITKTTGDVNSIWTIEVTPLARNSNAIRVLVEYSLSNALVEPLVDLLVQQIASPQIATENMNRFKAAVEARAKTRNQEESLTQR
jgi:uncharacterized membrane protein